MGAKMRLTLLVRADNTGLGIQTRDYYRHLKPNKTVIIDISIHNGNEQHYDWYKDAHLIKGFPTEADVDQILHDTDVLLTAETPYTPLLYTRAKAMGVKTICVENPEFFDQFKYPDYPLPDMVILPSVWLEQEIRDFCEPRGVKVVQLHHPVDRDEFPFIERTTSKPIHIAGKPAAYDRNGTWDYMNACPDGRVTTQSEDLAWNIRKKYRASNVFTNIENPRRIYEMGDVMVIPRKYGGNCLPLNEALSSGMPVIMPDISPNNHILPKEWLVPAEVTGHFEPRGKVDIYTANPDALRAKVEWFKNQDMKKQSQIANKIADTISWKTLLPKWEEAIRSVL
jgi:glycosyltransferase involved in cell wall biosynthesis